MKVNIKRTDTAKGLAMPAYQTEGAAGFDLIAAIPDEKVLKPGERAIIPSGLHVELPVGFELQVRPRSGLAAKNGVTVLNSPGTIDSDYRGEVGVILINHGHEDFTVRRGERIAQAVIAAYNRAELVEVDELGQTERGEGGFGSTGTAAKTKAKG